MPPLEDILNGEGVEREQARQAPRRLLATDGNVDRGEAVVSREQRLEFRRRVLLDPFSETQRTSNLPPPRVPSGGYAIRLT